MEQEIISPVSKELLKSELTRERQLRMTNKSNNEIYVVTAHQAPNVMREIGRLREIAFREAGGGTGKEVDIDEFDTCENCYKQLIVWNPDEEEIIGGYRYLMGTDWELDDQGQPILATSHMFHFSEKFLRDYMPYTVELGRSFVSLEYQNVQKNTKSIFALDNLWDGLGALTVLFPNLKYFFGKMTMYPSYVRKGRDMILYFLKKHFDDKENLITPMKPLVLESDPDELERLFSGNNFKEDYRILNSEVRKMGYNIPPLVNAYMGLSPTMKLFGTAINYGFGDVEETGILIAVDEILEQKRVRHIDSFIKEHPEALKITGNELFPRWEYSVPKLGIKCSHVGNLHNRQTDTIDFLIDIEGIDVGHTADVVDNGHETGLKVRIVDVVLTADTVDELTGVETVGIEDSLGHGLHERSHDLVTTQFHIQHGLATVDLLYRDLHTLLVGRTLCIVDMVDKRTV